MEDPILYCTAPNRDAEKDQEDRFLSWIREFVAGDFSGRMRIDAEFLTEFAMQGFGGRFAGLDLAAGELPLERMGLIRAAAADEDGAIAFQNARYNHGLWGVIRQEDSLHLCFTVSPQLIEHFRNPRNVGALPPPAITVEAQNPVCGDILRLSVRMEGGRVAEAAYKVRGCAASIGAGSALTELLTGQDRAGMALIDAATVDAAVGGLANESKHAAALCVDAVRAILKLC